MGSMGRQPFENSHVWLRSSAAKPDALPYLIALKLHAWLAKKFQINTEIKRPNDLLVNGKKLCGILVEKISRGDAYFWVIGIGLNLNQHLFPETLTEATSMAMLSGETYDKTVVTEGLIEECALWFGE
jgi:BirA family biotin operon repressor/biotin-[acetyl-CoA-carboxylase] ligase